MSDGPRNLGLTLLIAAALLHLFAVLSPAWVQVKDHKTGRDFASYYYAVQVAHEGGDPYKVKELNQAARRDGVRKGVHPFLYAPPFLLLMSWAVPYDLPGAYHLWFWLDELLMLGAALTLWAWWRPLSQSTGWMLAVLIAIMTAVPNNHVMGQANFPGLWLAVGGLWATERRRPALGGVLMGAACMLKMSPALFVMWWLLRREWVAVGASLAAAVALSLLSLGMVNASVQLRFFTEVLPGFGSGDYNGLGVPIGLFGNHSLPNLWHQLIPSGGPTLSTGARALSSASSLGLLALLGVAFRRPTREGVQVANQIGAVCVALLLIPVYTYEHHMVWALPSALAAAVAVERGRLRGGWALLVGLGITGVVFDLATLKRTAEAMPHGFGAIAWGLQELKSVGLLALLAANLRAGSKRE